MHNAAKADYHVTSLMTKPTEIVNRFVTLLMVVTLPLAQQKPPAERPDVILDYGLLFDNYDSSRTIKSRNRSLDDAAEFLRLSPNFQGSLISYGSRVSYLGEARLHADELKNYLVKKRGVNPDRIVIIDGGHCDNWEVQLWFYVREAPEKPTAWPCLDPKEVRILKRRPQNKVTV